MKNHAPNYAQEFRALTEDVTDTIDQMGDPVAIGAMLYRLAEERKASNLVIRDLSAKFDTILSKLERIEERLDNQEMSQEDFGEDDLMISGKDEEILDFIKSKKRVCADDLQEHFQYKGRNAASARLNKLYREKLVKKMYAGKVVYYALASQ